MSAPVAVSEITDQGDDVDDQDDNDKGSVRANYYSSVPASVGRTMREELQRQLGVTATTTTINRSSSMRPPRPLQQSSSFATGGTSPTGSTTSLPAAAGRAMQTELQRRLRLPPSHRRGASTDMTMTTAPSIASSTSGGSPRAAVSSPRVSGGRPPDEWYSYHATVSGVSGSNLATELKEHLKKMPSSLGSERDLLGRKVGGAAGGGAAGLSGGTPRASSKLQQLFSMPSSSSQPPRVSSSRFGARSNAASERAVSAATPMSTALLGRKNSSSLHALRRSTTVGGGSSRSGSSGATTGNNGGGAALLPPTAATAGRSASLTLDIPMTSSGNRASLHSTHRSVNATDSFNTHTNTRNGSSGGDHSAMLLERTFSVGASLHLRGRPTVKDLSGGAAVISVHDGREEDEQEEEEEEPTTTTTTKEDDGGASSVRRNASDTAIRDDEMQEDPDLKGADVMCITG